MSVPKGQPTIMASVQDVAEMLHMSENTTRRMVKDRVLPAFKIGTMLRIPIAAVHEMLDGARL